MDTDNNADDGMGSFTGASEVRDRRFFLLIWLLNQTGQRDLSPRNMAAQEASPIPVHDLGNTDVSIATAFTPDAGVQHAGGFPLSAPLHVRGLPISNTPHAALNAPDTGVLPCSTTLHDDDLPVTQGPSTYPPHAAANIPTAATATPAPFTLHPAILPVLPHGSNIPALNALTVNVQPVAMPLPSITNTLATIPLPVGHVPVANAGPNVPTVSAVLNPTLGVQGAQVARPSREGVWAAEQYAAHGRQHRLRQNVRERS